MGRFQYPFNTRIPEVPSILTNGLASNFRQAETEAGAQAKVDAYAQTASGLFIPKSIGDAKGDLIGFSADSTPVRIPAAAGDNYLPFSKSSAAGGVEWVSRPSCRVYANVSGNIVTVNAATVTPIPYNAEMWDTGSMHNTSTNNTRIYLPAIGLWEIGANIYYLNSTGYGNATDLWIALRRNGSTWDLQTVVSSYGAVDGYAVNPGGSTSTIVQTTDTDDYFEVCAYSDATATQVVGIGDQPSLNTAWARYLGPG